MKTEFHSFLKLTEQNGSIENLKIIKDLKISEATLRRDLISWKKQKLKESERECYFKKGC